MNNEDKQELPASTQVLLILAESVLMLAKEVRNLDPRQKTRKKLSALDTLTAELESFIHVKCGTCSIKERLDMIDNQAEREHNGQRE